MFYSIRPGFVAADALEQRYVEMRTSLEFPDAGDGLVAKIDIPEDTIVSLMSGLIFTTEQFVEERKKIEDWILENNFDYCTSISSAKHSYKSLYW